jgi:hypothetical protein
MILNIRFMYGNRNPEDVVNEFISRLEINPISIKKSNSENGMGKVDMEISGGIDDASVMESKLGDHLWHHEWTEKHVGQTRNRNCYETIIDSRNRVMFMKEVFWIRIYAEQKESREV